MTLVPLAPWRPDVSAVNSQFAADVLNVLWATDAYNPFPKLVPFSGAAASQPLWGFTARTAAGQAVIFIGTATKLYKLNTTTLAWDDVSRPATTYGATVDERWQATQFGDHVIFVNVNDNPQVYDLSSSATFDNLAGSPPRARHIAVWGDFVALGGLSGFENRVHWSGLDDDTMWTPGTNNCDFQDFPDGGEVQGMTDATNPIVIQRYAIRFGTFVPGSIEVFTFQKVHDRRGAVAPYSICSRGPYVFFADSGGFFQLSTDGQLKEIGLEKVDRTVFSAIAGPDIAAIIAAIDPFFNRVYFAARYNSASTSFDRLIIYDWGVGEWTQATASTNVLFPLASATLGYTLEGLDAISASLDALPFSLDSRVWQGGAPVMAAIDANFKLGFYSGTNAEATMTTQEMGDTSGMMLRITETMPVVDTNTVFVSFGARNKRGDAPNWSAEASPSSNTGIIRKRARARFHQFRIRIPADTVWTHAQGLDPNGTPAGKR